MRSPRTRSIEVGEFAGIPIYEANSKNNISYESPCFAGFSADDVLPDADVGLLVDVEVPWFPAEVQPNEKSFWAHIDVDVLKIGSPMWTFPGHLRMQGNTGRILDQLLTELKAKATPRFKAAAAARLDRLKASASSATRAPPNWPPTRANPARSTRIISWPSSARCWTTRTSSSTKPSPIPARCCCKFRACCPIPRSTPTARVSAGRAAWRSAPSLRRRTA